MFENIRIVLVETSHPGNIGASARAMKTMGLEQLTLVRPKFFPHAEADALASGATDLLRRARVVDSVEEALNDVHWVLGTSSRARSVAMPTLDPRAASLLARQRAQQGPIALLFGPERTGLTNDCLDICHQLVTIPTNQEYASLNLASAVQILSYELRLAALHGSCEVRSPEFPLATVPEMNGFYQHLQQALIEFDFLDRSNPKLLMRRLRRLYNRAQPDQREINILRGIITAAQSKNKNN
jgi:tRNA (cytidine32/uridine32-2'-O)-methyltransferase